MLEHTSPKAKIGLCYLRMIKHTDHTLRIVSTYSLAYLCFSVCASCKESGV